MSSSQAKSTATRYDRVKPRPPLLFFISSQGLRIPVEKSAAFLSPKLQREYRFHCGPKGVRFDHESITLRKIVSYLNNHSPDKNMDPTRLEYWDRFVFLSEPLPVLLNVLECAITLEITPMVLLLEEKILSVMTDLSNDGAIDGV